MDNTIAIFSIVYFTVHSLTILFYGGETNSFLDAKHVEQFLIKTDRFWTKENQFCVPSSISARSEIRDRGEFRSI